MIGEPCSAFFRSCEARRRGVSKGQLNQFFSVLVPAWAASAPEASGSVRVFVLFWLRGSGNVWVCRISTAKAILAKAIPPCACKCGWLVSLSGWQPRESARNCFEIKSLVTMDLVSRRSTFLAQSQRVSRSGNWLRPFPRGGGWPAANMSLMVTSRDASWSVMGKAGQ